MTRIAKPVSLIVALTLSIATVAAQEGGHRGTKNEQDACTPDVYKFCEAAIPDEGRIVACLKANLKLLSPMCRKVIARD
jgi:Cysteine rich repeat